MKRKSNNYVMLSFDTEEFDIPREQGKVISLEEKIRVSVEGTNIILDVLKIAGVHATFFCTTTLLLNAPEIAKRIISEGHEMASHGCDHANPQPQHVIDSKRMLEREYHVHIYGYRQPRMFAVSDDTLRDEGYSYNSSLNPTLIPGRYMHLHSKRNVYMSNGILQIPTSVTPILRFPLFWLSMHHLPMWFYSFLVRRTLHHDGYFNTYYHPWEFVKIYGIPKYGVPYIIGHNTGKPMERKLLGLIQDLQKVGANFITYNEFRLFFHTTND